MPNPTVVSDLEDRFRALTADERRVATALLGDAWEEVLARVPTLEQRIADGQVTDGLVRRVITAMVVRVLRNPEALRRWGVDDGTFERDAALSSGLLYLSAEEQALLSGTAATTSAASGALPPLSLSAAYWRG